MLPRIDFRLSVCRTDAGVKENHLRKPSTMSASGNPSALEFRNRFDHRVAIAKRLFPDLEPKARCFGRGHIPVDRHRDILQKPRIEIVVEVIDTFENVEVCQSRRGM